MPHPLVYDPVEASRDRWIQQGWSGTATGMAAVVSVMRAEQIFLNRAATVLRRNLLIYGVGGLIVPFVGIKLIDMILAGLGLAKGVA